jgi:6-phosphogluconolactonase
LIKGFKKMHKCLMILLLMSVLIACHKETLSMSPSNELVVYVGTYTSQGSEGIYVYKFDPATGALNLQRAVADAENPSFLAVDPKQRFLYAVHENSDYLGKNQGSVRAFKINADTFNLMPLNEQPSLGAHPCFVAVDPSGAFLALANYTGGNIALLPINSDGSLQPPSDMVQHTGSGANPQRQEGPHAHSVNFSPDGRFVLAADLGIDKIMIYQVDAENGKLIPNNPPFAATRAGAGPRHLTFDPTGNRVYVINELNSTITAFAYSSQNGSLSELQTVATLPANYFGSNTCADIHIAPNGRFLYGSNRGHDSLAIFKIDEKTGRLTPAGHASSGGKTPRNFAIDPTGNYLLAANQSTNNIVVFRINQEDGSLTSLHDVKVSMPVCVRMMTTEQR